ncbi:MAG: hypothetical protein ACPMAQ_01875, partial [Phycisphaerae bacterium]
MTTRKMTMTTVSLLAGLRIAAAADIERRTIEAPPSPPYHVWPSTPPADCPFPKSDRIAGIAFTGKHAEYTGADTWYPSWA